MPSPTPLSNKTSPDPGAFGERDPLTRASSDESGRSLGQELGSAGQALTLGTGAAGTNPATVDTTLAVRKRDGMGVQEVKPLNRFDFGDFYPDGGWGWVVLGAATVVHALCNGFHLAYGTLYLSIQKKFRTSDISTAWLGSLGIAVSLFISPIVTIICRRKSPRLFAVIGGLISALGCLFLAFSTQHEQLFTSHCVVMSLGSGFTIVTANIMVGRYFRRKRELAEMILVAGSGVGAAVMSTLLRELI
ncbi:monocarboxylate transporter 14-like, partial [Physella acuta]